MGTRISLLVVKVSCWRILQMLYLYTYCNRAKNLTICDVETLIGMYKFITLKWTLYADVYI